MADENNLTTLAKRLRPLLGSYIQNLGGQLVGEGPGIDVVKSGDLNTVGLGGDTILLYHSDGSPVSEFAATDAGLDLATADVAAVTDVVIIPACVALSADHTLGAAHYVFPQDVILDLSITLIENSRVYFANVQPSGNSAGVIQGFIGPTSGTARLYEVTSIPTNAGAGGVHAVEARDTGIIRVYGIQTLLDGRNTGGGAGDKYAGYVAGGSNIYAFGGHYLPTADPFNA